jgi:hypothetical protein
VAFRLRKEQQDVPDPRRHGQHRSNLEDSAVARMTQINIDASRLQGVDLSKVLNQKIAVQKAERTQLSTLSAKASLSAASRVYQTAARRKSRCQLIFAR